MTEIRHRMQNLCKFHWEPKKKKKNQADSLKESCNHYSFVESCGYQARCGLPSFKIPYLTVQCAKRLSGPVLVTGWCLSKWHVTRKTWKATWCLHCTLHNRGHASKLLLGRRSSRRYEVFSQRVWDLIQPLTFWLMTLDDWKYTPCKQPGLAII